MILDSPGEGSFIGPVPGLRPSPKTSSMTRSMTSFGPGLMTGLMAGLMTRFMAGLMPGVLLKLILTSDVSVAAENLDDAPPSREVLTGESAAGAGLYQRNTHVRLHC